MSVDLDPPPLHLTLREIAADDPLVAPVLDDLTRDYTERYPTFDVAGEMSAYPAAEFAPPHGAFLALFSAYTADAPGGTGELVAAGAYRRYDPTTAELKRVWTSARHRRQGLARRIVTELEQHARARGYRRVFLTTGPGQPEARRLYLATGYTALGDHDAIVARADAALPFEKHLTPPEGPA